jgi:hypothetical protein
MVSVPSAKKNQIDDEEWAEHFGSNRTGDAIFSDSLAVELVDGCVVGSTPVGHVQTFSAIDVHEFERHGSRIPGQDANGAGDIRIDSFSETSLQNAE